MAENKKNSKASEKDALAFTPSEKEKTSFSFSGENYSFTENAPEKIRFNNRIYSQAELLKDKEAMEELIVGQSSLIEKI